MATRVWKVGELARRTGLSVHTLHHCDQNGLLRPWVRSTTGHREYDAGDVARLQRIQLLRRLGFTLSEVRMLLRRSGLRFVLRLHIEELRAEFEHHRAICRLLEAIEPALERVEPRGEESV